ncbi:equilibrative nucleoside transporter 1-like [Tropilaelaps mercedesae]|uniref:Equilibrative nucleoside transporter 1-like n=1 Tax=Tropilaelaps mercedesae TaxID=418985 RepID=A0A1V9XHU9_9ACAR|nr:equilibrative nucleoside transporter 1-like [Tropilaelaps mercedesae]
MSSFKLNDPLAPTYRRNYRTHLALEGSAADLNCCYVTNGQCPINGGDFGRPGPAGPFQDNRKGALTTVDTLEDEAPLLSGFSAGSENGTVNSLTSELRDNAPVDHDGMVRFAFFLFGLVSLLPWNFFITASEYWMFKFRDLPSTGKRGGNGDGRVNSTQLSAADLPKGRSILDDSGKTPLQSEFFSALSIASNVPFLLTLYLAALLNEKLPARIRNPFALIATTLLFGSVTALAVVDTDQWQEWFYRLTLVQMLLVAASAAVFQGGIMGVASTFPSEYTHACVVGQSAGGVFASVLQVGVLLLNVPAVISGLIYFMLAFALLMFSILVLVRTQRSAFFRHYVRYSPLPGEGQSSFQRRTSANSVLDDDYASTYESNFEVKVRTGLVARKLWHYCVALVLIYVVTIGAFPGVLVHVEASGRASVLWARLFSPVACFLVFNVGDLVGRLLASSSWSAFPVRRENLLVGLTLMRLLFLPLLFACNVQPRAKPSMPLPVFFNSDFAFIGLNAIFALSNGYLTSASMVLGPKKLEYFLQEKAGAVLVAMLATGMTIGSVASLLFVRAFFHSPKS